MTLISIPGVNIYQLINGIKNVNTFVSRLIKDGIGVSKKKKKKKAFSIERNENSIVQYVGPHYPSSPPDGSTAEF